MASASLQSPPSNIWWVFLLQGIAGILLGLMLVTDPKETLVVLVTFLGFYWLITGVLALVQIFVDRSVPWILVAPQRAPGNRSRHPRFEASAARCADRADRARHYPRVEGLFMGGFEIIKGFQGGGMGSFILGVINILVGLLLLSSPVTAALAVPLVFGVLLFVQGVALIIWAFRVRA